MNRKFNQIVLLVGIATILSFSPANTESATDIGSKAPEINLKDVNGKELKLSSIKGKIVLIDFWASWCGPCRAENPALAKAFTEYKNAKFKTAKGFEIYSVSLDKNKEAWIKAIAQDKLEWAYHVSDLQGFKTSASVSYGISFIPQNFLINEKGIIIAKNLRGPALEKELKKLLK